MIFAKYDEQRSFPEYVDMVFKDLIVKKDCDFRCELPIASWVDLFEFLKAGYLPDFCDCPEWLIDEEYKGNIRKLKKFSKKIFKEFGEEDKALEAHAKFEIEMDAFESGPPFQ